MHVVAVSREVGGIPKLVPGAMSVPVSTY